MIGRDVENLAVEPAGIVQSPGGMLLAGQGQGLRHA